jgi:prepilin-type N-terminal cleavage/methylation domain-containing protein
MTKARGFTLVEVIAASAILAGGVVVIGAITSRSLDALRLDTEYSQAWEVLDRQLTVIDYVGIDTIVQKGVTQGDFTEGSTTYAWSIAVTDELYDKLKRVDITVAWTTGGKPRRISATTMLNGSGVVSETTDLPTDEATGDATGDTGTTSSGSGGGQ